MKNMSLSKRTILFVVAALIISSSIVGLFAYELEKSEVIEANANRALAITRTVSASLDAEQFSLVMETLEPNEYYKDFSAFLDRTMDKCDILYLYVVDSKIDTEVTYFAEGYPQNNRQEEPEILLGDTEDLDVYPDEFFETIEMGVETTTDMYELGGYGKMVSAYTPIFDKSGSVIGVIGVDLTVNDAIDSANQFGLLMIAIIAVICLIAVFLVMLFVKTYIGKPVTEIKDAADMLALGNSEISVSKRRGDEIGHLAESFISMVENVQEQSQLIERLANGDLTVEVHPRSVNDTVNNSLSKMATELSAMMADVNSSISQVSASSKQIADGSQSVAHGSSEQAASIEQLSASVHALSDSIEQNADMAEEAAKLSSSVMESAEKGNAQMEQMLLAVNDINNASMSIGKVMKVIDDIAFQTNILALNASVEAARAGVHGKGFAVVAEEVRNLASKSADAARDSERLISDSIEKSALGAKIAKETSGSLHEIVSGIGKNTEIINKIARVGGEQVSSVGEINRAIDQVSKVVQQNSASAEESAAASEEMSGQAVLLGDLISYFKLKDESGGKYLT